MAIKTKAGNWFVKFLIIAIPIIILALFLPIKIGFLTLTYTDLIDMALIAIAFSWVYKSLKGTVAIQIFFGLFIVYGLSFITEAINLKSLNFVAKMIFNVWILAFIILFQPELRRLLLLITRSPIFHLFGKQTRSKTLDEILDAVLEMSEKHIGALIVFIRGQNVQMTLETGIPLQAMVSKELIMSIFNVKSPLHDGAVIIDNQVIVAARCVLPLSTTTKYDGRHLGTRHRAALGLSEQVDALILVVSEETGSISLAEGGFLNLDIKKEHLAGILSGRLGNV